MVIQVDWFLLVEVVPVVLLLLEVEVGLDEQNGLVLVEILARMAMEQLVMVYH